MKSWAAAAVFVVFATLLSTAQAQTVWRCGEGGRTYSDSPCPGGQPVKAGDPRTDAQTQSARDAVKRDQELAARMRKERLEDEKRDRAANAGAASLGPTRISAPPEPRITQKKNSKPPRHPSKAAPADAGTWRAAVAPSRQKKD